MTPFFVVLIAVGVLLILIGVALRPLWRALIKPFYRSPDAMEPSALGWAVRRAVLIAAGALVVLLSAVQIGALAGQAPDPEEQARASCSDFVSLVGTPDSLDAADEAIANAAAEELYVVVRTDMSSDETLPLPSGDEVLTIDTTQWTVTDADATEVASFTWTSADSVPGRFTAQECD